MQMQEGSRTGTLLHNGEGGADGALPAPSRGLALRLTLQQGDLTSLTALHDAQALKALAHEAIVCEQRGTLTCFLIQAVALLRSWHIATGNDPRRHQAKALEHVYAFYIQHGMFSHAAAALAPVRATDAPALTPPLLQPNSPLGTPSSFPSMPEPGIAGGHQWGENPFEQSMGNTSGQVMAPHHLGSTSHANIFENSAPCTGPDLLSAADAAPLEQDFSAASLDANLSSPVPALSSRGVQPTLFSSSVTALSTNAPFAADQPRTTQHLDAGVDVDEKSAHAQPFGEALPQLPPGRRPRDAVADGAYEGKEGSEEDHATGHKDGDGNGDGDSGHGNDNDDDEEDHAISVDFGLLRIGAPATRDGAAPVRDHHVKQRIVEQCLAEYFASFELEAGALAPKRVELRFEDAARSCIRRMWSGRNGVAGVRHDVLVWLAPLLHSVRVYASRFWSRSPEHAPPAAISIGMTLLPPCLLPANHRQPAPTVVAFARWAPKQITEQPWVPALSTRWCWTVVDPHSKHITQQGPWCATQALQDHIVQLELQARNEVEPLPEPAECPVLGRLEAADELFEQWMRGDDRRFDLYAERRTLNDIIMDRTNRASGAVQAFSTPDAHEHRFALQLRRPRNRDDYRAGEVHTLETFLIHLGGRRYMERRLRTSRECVRLVQQLYSRSSGPDQAHGGIQARLFQVSVRHIPGGRFAHEASGEWHRVTDFTIDELRGCTPADILPHRYVAPTSDATCAWLPRQRDIYSLAVLVWEILAGRVSTSAQPPILTQDNFDALVQDKTVAATTEFGAPAAAVASPAAPWRSLVHPAKLRELLQSAWSGHVQDTDAFLQQLHDQLGLLETIHGAINQAVKAANEAVAEATARNTAASSSCSSSSSSSSSLPPSMQATTHVPAPDAHSSAKTRIVVSAHTAEEWFADYLNVPRYFAKLFFTSSSHSKNAQALHVLHALQGGYDLADLEARGIPLLVALRFSELGLLRVDTSEPSSVVHMTSEEVHPRLRCMHLASFGAWFLHSMRHGVSDSIPWPLPQYMEQQESLLQTLVPFAVYASVSQLVRQWRMCCHWPASRFQCSSNRLVAAPSMTAPMLVHWFPADMDPCYSALATAFLDRPALLHEALQLRQILAHVCEAELLDEVLDLSGRFDLPLGLLCERGPWTTLMMQLVDLLEDVCVVWFVRTRSQRVMTRIFTPPGWITSPPCAGVCRRTVLLCADTWSQASTSTSASTTLGIRPGSVGIAWWPSYNRFHAHISTTDAAATDLLSKLGAAMCATMPTSADTDRMQPQQQLLDTWCVVVRASRDDTSPLFAGRERLTALTMPSPLQPHSNVFAAVAALLAPLRHLGEYELRQLCAWKMADLPPESPLLPDGWTRMDHTQLRALRIVNTAWPGGDVELRMLVELLGIHISVLRATIHPSQQLTRITPSMSWVPHTLRPGAACVALLYQAGAREFHWVDAITDAVPRSSLASPLASSSSSSSSSSMSAAFAANVTTRRLFPLVSRQKVEQQSAILLPAHHPHPTSSSAVQLRQHVWMSIVCDECNQRLVGERLRCAVCADYDVCTKCFFSADGERHPTSHLLLRQAPPPPSGTGAATAGAAEASPPSDASVSSSAFVPMQTD